MGALTREGSQQLLPFTPYENSETISARNLHGS